MRPDPWTLLIFLSVGTATCLDLYKMFGVQPMHTAFHGVSGSNKNVSSRALPRDVERTAIKLKTSRVQTEKL